MRAVDAVSVGAGRRRLLICRPNTNGFGHSAIELLYAVDVACATGAWLVVVYPSNAPNSALFSLQSGSARVWCLPPVIGMPLWAVARWVLPTARGCRSPTFQTRNRWRKSLVIHTKAFGERHSWRRTRTRLVQKMIHRVLRVPFGKEPQPVYFRRRLLRDAAPLTLPGRVDRRCAQTLEALGVAPDAPMVAVHVRESGYKLGREVRDKVIARADAVGAEVSYLRDDATRDGDIDEILDGLDTLVGSGFVLVRLGDPTMRPVVRPGIVDLASLPDRPPALELHVLARSRFLVGSESGPQLVAIATGTPTLIVGATDPISSYPIRQHDLVLFKHVVELSSGRALGLQEMLAASYLERLRDSRVFEYRSNERHEIRAAAAEMLECLAGATTRSAFQETFHEAVLAAASASSAHKYVGKWGADDGFIGDGRVAEVSASRWLNAG